MFSAVLFDFDETLAETLPDRLAAYRAAFRECLGKELSDEQLHKALLSASNLEAQMECLGGAEVAPALIKAYRVHYYGPEGPPVKLFTGVQDCLYALGD